MTDENEKSLDELLNKPLNELTENEAARVIEYKAKIKARDDNYQARLTQQAEALQEIVEMHKRTAEQAISDLKSLQNSALDRLARASRGEAV